MLGEYATQGLWFRRFLLNQAGFCAVEAALLACVLGAACIITGNKLSVGAAAAAGNVDSEIATGAPGSSGVTRPPLSWQVPIGAIRQAGTIEQPRGRFQRVPTIFEQPRGTFAQLRGTFQPPQGTFQPPLRRCVSPGAGGAGAGRDS